MFLDKKKVQIIMEMLDSLPKEERDMLVEKYYIDYKNLMPVVKKMKTAFEALTDEEKEQFLKCIDYKKPSEKMKEEMKEDMKENMGGEEVYTVSIDE